MEQQKNIIIPLTEKSESVLRNIIKKYGLEENQKEFFSKIKEHQLLNETIVIKLTRDLMAEKISTKTFLDSLKKDLNITTEKTKNIAKDIMHNLVPLLKIFTEEELENYKSTKKPSTEKETSTAKIILEKIKQNKPLGRDVSVPTVKKLEVKNVEKNAELLKGRGKRGQDIYKEPIE